MTSKTRHVDGGGGNPRFDWNVLETMRFVQHREFRKDIQIQIDKPKYRETHMKSKTRHIDGGGGNTQFEVCSWEDSWKT